MTPLANSLDTCGFCPRVLASALRAPVFLGSFTGKTGRCAPSPPPAHRSFPDPSGNINYNIIKQYEKSQFGKKIRESASDFTAFLVVEYNNSIAGCTVNQFFFKATLKQKIIPSHHPSPIYPSPITPP
jgi:hypothetical protein